MPTAPIDVDTDTYLSAGALFLAVNDTVADVVVAAATSAVGGGGMAGTDSGGVDWSTGYDTAAARALSTGATLVDSLGHVGALLAASADNHAAAEASSAPGAPVYAGSGGVPGAVSVVPATPPSADGTSDDPPAGWFLIAHLLASTWPNGHQAQLRTVAAGWTTAATDLDAAADRLTRGIGDVSTLRSPEVDAAVATCCDVQQSVRDLSSAYATLGVACAEYADRLDEAHSDVLRELAETAAESALIQLVSAAAAVPTAGGSEVAGQAAQAARLAATAARVDRILAKLATFVRTVVSSIRAVSTRLAEPLSRLRSVLAKGATRAVETVAGKLPRTASCDVRKFSEYVLAPGRDAGKFAIYQRLGYGSADAQRLADLYIDQAASRFRAGDFTMGVLDQYGQRITIDILIPGQGASSGTRAIVKSGWIIQGDGTIRLTTPFAGWG